jgi:alpha-tubulin suppressor-like RCC1 family protein
LGNGNNRSSNVPVAVIAASGAGPLTSIKSIVTGLHTPSYCAVLASGAVACWGKNVSGSLGTGSMDGPETCLFVTRSPCSMTARPVKGIAGKDSLTGVHAVVAGGNGYCAILETGSMACWGEGEAGELGNGAMANSAVPIPVTIGS